VRPTLYLILPFSTSATRNLNEMLFKVIHTKHTIFFHHDNLITNGDGVWGQYFQATRYRNHIIGRCFMIGLLCALSYSSVAITTTRHLHPWRQHNLCVMHLAGDTRQDYTPTRSSRLSRLSPEAAASPWPSPPPWPPPWLLPKQATTSKLSSSTRESSQSV